MNLLLVEDDFLYRQSLKKVLVEHGYNVDDVEDPITGIEYFSLNKYDLVISDLMMETMDGNRFLAHIRKISPGIPTIMLTGQPTSDAELTALNNGVSRYLVKGMRMDILLKYVAVLIEQAQEGAAQESVTSVSENLVLDLRSRTTTKDGEKVELTNKEFGILYMLLSEKGKAISRSEFINELWDKRFEEVEDRVIDVHIKMIRKKLQVSSILAIRGYGYKWEE